MPFEEGPGIGDGGVGGPGGSSDSESIMRLLQQISKMIDRDLGHLASQDAQGARHEVHRAVRHVEREVGKAVRGERRSMPPIAIEGGGAGATMSLATTIAHLAHIAYCHIPGLPLLMEALDHAYRAQQDEEERMRRDPAYARQVREKRAEERLLRDEVGRGMRGF